MKLRVRRCNDNLLPTCKDTKGCIIWTWKLGIMWCKLYVHSYRLPLQGYLEKEIRIYFHVYLKGPVAFKMSQRTGDPSL
jgi:hypothetical protein